MADVPGAGGGRRTASGAAAPEQRAEGQRTEGRPGNDRACAVEGYIGLLQVGSAKGLVLGDEPASTTFLPTQGVFVRWSAAESEESMLTSVDAAMRAASWEPELTWQVPGPVVLFDSAWTGEESRQQDHVRVDLEAGSYAVRAAYAEPDPQTGLMLIALRRLHG
ncbi:hypothetical protein J5Y04_17045 [Kitasatospora sp. RG8]|nr:hypothetical protein [Kitasatospora sp. RG8]